MSRPLGKRLRGLRARRNATRWHAPYCRQVAMAAREWLDTQRTAPAVRWPQFTVRTRLGRRPRPQKLAFNCVPYYPMTATLGYARWWRIQRALQVSRGLNLFINTGDVFR